MQGDRGAAAVALGEVVLGQHLTDGASAEQGDHRRQVHALQPLGVVTDLQTRESQNPAAPFPWLVLPLLAQVGGGVGAHLLLGELHPRGALAGGVADPRREITDDQHRRMSQRPGRPRLAEQDAVLPSGYCCRWGRCPTSPAAPGPLARLAPSVPPGFDRHRWGRPPETDRSCRVTAIAAGTGWIRHGCAGGIRPRSYGQNASASQVSLLAIFRIVDIKFATRIASN